ncbi:O-antigen ligase family protein [Halomonas sp. BM-2019]|uniref:O-antigen ligase family protein n=1 Tax=Halomonas sp. BM-2019 TaxID=2811227 RepID=UPI001B3C1CF5|nr:MAG: O-antigen ligase family protein [Halomonas sp. BM-2019]
MIFEKRLAVNLVLATTFLVLVLLVSTPLRVHAVIALLFLYALGFLVYHRRKLAFCRRDGVVAMLLSLYALSHLPVFVMDGYSWRYLSPGLHMVAIIPVYLMLRHCWEEIETGRFRNALEYGAFLGSLGGGLLAFYQAFWLEIGRADGFLFHINFGYLVGSLFFLQVALWPSSRRRALLTLGIALALAATLLSTARGAYFAIPIVLGGVAMLHWRRVGVRNLALGAVAFCVLAVGSYQFVPLVELRVDYTVEEITRTLEGDVRHSSGGRLRLWVVAIEAFKERPLVGLTYGEREALNESLVGTGIINPWVATISRGHAHSQYFETLATGGVVGMAALFFYLIFPCLYFFVRHSRQPENAFYLVGGVFSFAFIVFCLTEVALQHEMIGTYYGFMLVVLYVLAERRKTVIASPGHAESGIASRMEMRGKNASRGSLPRFQAWRRYGTLCSRSGGWVREARVAAGYQLSRV